MTEDTAPIVRGKPFQSGEDPRRNMNGKPKGSRHFTTLFKEAVTKIADGEAESDDILIVKKVIAKAKDGDFL